MNFLNDIVYPEIIRLAIDEEITSDFRLTMAHIVMFDNESLNRILLNENVLFMGNVVLKKKEYKTGDQIRSEDIIDILGLYPQENNDADAAHIMMVTINGRWFMAANFVYNRGKARSNIEDSKKSLEAAKNAQSEKSWRYFISELYESIKLSASAIFMMLRYGKFSMLNYDEIRKVFDTYSGLGNIDEEYFVTFEKVHSLFLNTQNLNDDEKKDFKIIEDDANKMVITSNNLIEKAESLLNLSGSGRSSEDEIIYFGTTDKV